MMALAHCTGVPRHRDRNREMTKARKPAIPTGSRAPSTRRAGRTRPVTLETALAVRVCTQVPAEGSCLVAYHRAPEGSVAIAGIAASAASACFAAASPPFGRESGIVGVPQFGLLKL